ncbi:hypothetical protein [Rikenella microfusus]|nr:hypothetical protein [Rikenella microfusus]
MPNIDARLERRNRGWIVVLLVLFLSGLLFMWPLGKGPIATRDTIVRIDTVRIIEKDTAVTQQLDRIQHREAIFQGIHRGMVALIWRRIVAATAALDTLVLLLSAPNPANTMFHVSGLPIRQAARAWYEVQLRNQLPE